MPNRKCWGSCSDTSETCCIPVLMYTYTFINPCILQRDAHDMQPHIPMTVCAPVLHSSCGKLEVSKSCFVGSWGTNRWGRRIRKPFACNLDLMMFVTAWFWWYTLKNEMHPLLFFLLVTFRSQHCMYCNLTLCGELCYYSPPRFKPFETSVWALDWYFIISITNGFPGNQLQWS